jgi:crotonobetainyl-CoA:carnitine CoA-transferase CaiB-like acyl-CoA transferase
MAEGGVLQGLRVIDLTDDTGRFATKLLTEAGAGVLRIGRGSPGAVSLRPFSLSITLRCTESCWGCLKKRSLRLLGRGSSLERLNTKRKHKRKT